MNLLLQIIFMNSYIFTNMQNYLCILFVYLSVLSVLSILFIYLFTNLINSIS